jgi:hypothetical protein
MRKWLGLRDASLVVPKPVPVPEPVLKPVPEPVLDAKTLVEQMRTLQDEPEFDAFFRLSRAATKLLHEERVSGRKFSPGVLDALRDLWHLHADKMGTLGHMLHLLYVGHPIRTEYFVLIASDEGWLRMKLAYAPTLARDSRLAHVMSSISWNSIMVLANTFVVLPCRSLCKAFHSGLPDWLLAGSVETHVFGTETAHAPDVPVVVVGGAPTTGKTHMACVISTKAVRENNVYMRLCRPEAGDGGAAPMGDPVKVVFEVLKGKLIPSVARMHDTNTWRAAVIVDECEADMDFARAVVAGWPRIVSDLRAYFRVYIPQASGLRIALIAVGNGCTLENLGVPAGGLEVLLTEMPLEIARSVIGSVYVMSFSEENRCVVMARSLVRAAKEAAAAAKAAAGPEGAAAAKAAAAEEEAAAAKKTALAVPVRVPEPAYDRVVMVDDDECVPYAKSMFRFAGDNLYYAPKRLREDAAASSCSTDSEAELSD